MEVTIVCSDYYALDCPKCNSDNIQEWNTKFFCNWCYHEWPKLSIRIKL